MRVYERIQELETKVSTLEAELREAKKDTARLDWLDHRCSRVDRMLKCWEESGFGEDIRAAIDAAKEEPHE